MGSKLGKDVEDVLRPPVDLGEGEEDDLFKSPSAPAAVVEEEEVAMSKGGLTAGKFGGEDEGEDLFAPGASSPTSAAPAPSAASALQAAATETTSSGFEDMSDDEEEPPAALATAAAPKKKKNLLSRIFSKPGGGRPTDLAVALKAEDERSASFRSTVASALSSYVPADIFADYGLGAAIDRESSEEKKASELKAELEGSGLAEQEAADAFAEVANAMLTSMTDRAAAALKNKDEEQTLVCLDDLADFIGGAGAVFTATVPGAQIEPVVYNGKTKKGQVENLYLEYLKATMSLEGMMGMMGGMMGQSGDNDSPEDKAGVDPEAAAKAEKAAERESKIGRLQQAFAIKEKKRANLESKVMKDLFMNMAKGGKGCLTLGD